MSTKIANLSNVILLFIPNIETEIVIIHCISTVVLK